MIHLERCLLLYTKVFDLPLILLAFRMMMMKKKSQSQYEQGTETINNGDEPPVKSEPETLSAVVNDAFRPSSHSDSIPDEDDDEEE
ncbi:hypothetical protein AVEN_135143-1 [Araneus ventricosus]|uniref:Uncharacterized protein n=1 Tax=Araneus ventricosus TaxID=182803 RepID=A0A4Y2DXV8_ARAVE|nr:hypothetical protein AVEN_135143-1 [Araneus ventricosus]